MYEAKYVIVDGSAIVFSAAIQHKDMVGYNEKCSGAGFVRFYAQKNEWDEDVVIAKCYGKSVSLGIESNPEEDSIIVTRQLTNPF
jgi:hypothetical protein